MTASPAFTRPGYGSGTTVSIPTENAVERISRTFEAHATENSLDRHGFTCAFARLVGSVPSRLEVAHVFGSREGGEVEKRVPRETFERYMAQRLEAETDEAIRITRAGAGQRRSARSTAQRRVRHAGRRTGGVSSRGGGNHRARGGGGGVRGG